VNRLTTIPTDSASPAPAAIAPSGPAPASIAIVTDAWHPQTNGVVRTLSTTCEVLRGWGHQVTIISPEGYPSIPAPTYPEIRLALTAPGAVGGSSPGSSPRRCISPPKARWASPHGVIA